MKLQIIVGATRPGRSTDQLAKWVALEAKNLPGAEVEIVDLADYEMPIFNEAISPRFNPDRVPEPTVQKWIDKIAEADAYVYVTPEYNHSIPGVLKNAIDFLTYEMVRKPATVVSHGTVGGARATMHLKEILSESRAIVLPSAVAFTAGMIVMGGVFDEEGNLADEAVRNNPYGPQTALKTALTELQWASDALSAARG
ncbi:MAG: NADPH-dependent reductase [Candidatus Saccharibacteria bacterium]|nr:NADPH-dependent reductase [Candidatus Saccharibacteria bacterium]